MKIIDIRKINLNKYVWVDLVIIFLLTISMLLILVLSKMSIFIFIYIVVIAIYKLVSLMIFSRVIYRRIIFDNDLSNNKRCFLKFPITDVSTIEDILTLFKRRGISHQFTKTFNISFQNPIHYALPYNKTLIASLVNEKSIEGIHDKLVCDYQILLSKNHKTEYCDVLPKGINCIIYEVPEGLECLVECVKSNTGSKRLSFISRFLYLNNSKQVEIFAFGNAIYLMLYIIKLHKKSLYS